MALVIHREAVVAIVTFFDLADVFDVPIIKALGLGVVFLELFKAALAFEDRLVANGVELYFHRVFVVRVLF